MIRVAAGEKLAFGQKDVKLTGWAIESRLYAEDPYRNFLPSIGRLTRYRPPSEGRHADGTIVRNDTGVYEGGEISMYYDPMVAKLCTWGSDRTAAIDAMGRALDDFEVEGIGHNLPFLSAVMGNTRFREGRLTTAFIAEEFPDGFAGVAPDAASARKTGGRGGSGQRSPAAPRHEDFRNDRQPSSPRRRRLGRRLRARHRRRDAVAGGRRLADHLRGRRDRGDPQRLAAGPDACDLLRRRCCRWA